MTESSASPSRTAGRLHTLAATAVHALCWLTLVVWQYQFVPLVLNVLEDIAAEMPSITPLVYRLSDRLSGVPIAVSLACLVLVLVFDAWLLGRLERSPGRRVLRELWSGLMVLAPLMVLAFSAVAFLLPLMKFAVQASEVFDDMAKVREADLQALEGEWRVVRTERAGTETPSTGSLCITVTDRYVTEFSWVRDDETATGELLVDVRPNPERISLQYATGANQGSRQHGIYDLACGNLMLCLAPVGAQEGDVPKAFVTESNNHTFYTFERVSPDETNAVPARAEDGR
jgi:uncharacterized protein (TIGR03067 family)